MHGNLCDDDLLNIIDSLSTSRKEGVLHLTNNDISIRIFFKNGNIVFASSNDENDRLGQVLIRGKINPSDLEMALQMMERTGKHLGTTLVEMGFLQQGELASYARRRVTTIIQSSMAWSEGQYVFEEQEVSAGRVETITLMTTDVILEGTQGVGESPENILALLGDLNNVLRQPKDPLAPYDDGSLSSTLEWILYQANGVLTINEIVAHSPLERNKTLQSIYALVSAGILEVDKPSEERARPEENGNESAASNATNGDAALSRSKGCATERLQGQAVPEKLGRYEVTELLGRGAMGAVYLAKDPTIDRVIAIKLILTASHMTAESLTRYKERFYQEAKAAGKLLHPGIVAVFDIGHTDKDMPFIVMEYVPGKTLQEILKKENLPVANTIDLSLNILEALGYAHRNGIVHRDIKPSNIAVVEGGCAKIMDFGIAHVVGGELTEADEVLGSLNYMAPEQLLKQAIDQRTDLFAFGVVVFRMLTGRLPFEGDSIAEVAHSILDDRPPAPSSINPAVSSALDDVVLRCLEKDPINRFEHAEDLRQALTSAKLRTEGTDTGISGFTLKKFVSKHMRLITAASLLALAAFALPFVYFPSNSSTSGAVAQDEGQSREAVVQDEAPSREQDRTMSPRTGPVPTEVEKARPPARSVPNEADLFYQAMMAFERGELVKSKTQVEHLLERNPSFSGAAELQAKIHMELWKDKLPFSILASHDHRVGSCTGTLTLTDSGIRFESDDHKWDWSFFEMRILDREDPSELFIETHEKDILIPGKPKRFRFKLAVPLKEDDWVRVQYLAKSQ